MPVTSAVLFPLLLLTSPPPAAELRKCVAAGTGAVSYQSLPCAEGSREAWVQPIKAGSAPRRPAAREPARAAGKASRRAPATTVRRSAARRPSPGQVRRARCEEARRKADQTRDRLWNKLDFQQRSELDASVARACARRR